VNGEQRVIDRCRQIALIPPLLSKQLIETDQQADIEYIKAYWSTYCHGAAPTFLRDRRGILPRVLSVRHIYITLRFSSSSHVRCVPLVFHRISTGLYGASNSMSRLTLMLNL